MQTKIMANLQKYGSKSTQNVYKSRWGWWQNQHYASDKSLWSFPSTKEVQTKVLSYSHRLWNIDFISLFQKFRQCKVRGLHISGFFKRLELAREGNFSNEAPRLIFPNQNSVAFNGFKVVDNIQTTWLGSLKQRF